MGMCIVLNDSLEKVTQQRDRGKMECSRSALFKCMFFFPLTSVCCFLFCIFFLFFVFKCVKIKVYIYFFVEFCGLQFVLSSLLDLSIA
jgi:hypothetical protein